MYSARRANTREKSQITAQEEMFVIVLVLLEMQHVPVGTLQRPRTSDVKLRKIKNV